MRYSFFLLILIFMALLGCQVPGEQVEDLSESVRVSAFDGTSSNPIVSHIYTADPTGRVFNGRLYVYASHDLDNQGAYNMYDYHVFSTDDLVNWQDHGVAFNARTDVTWTNKLYAPDCVERNGKYYLVFPNDGSSIGVAVSDNPYGPFVDALGEPLVDNSTPGHTIYYIDPETQEEPDESIHWVYDRSELTLSSGTEEIVSDNVNWVFDPGVLIDDDGQAYLYYGGGMPGTGINMRVVKLNEDMISLEGPAVPIEAPGFFEASFCYKRDGVYYLSYSSHWEEGYNIGIEYMTSSDPVTGWTAQGTALPKPPQGAENNHHSMVEYQGQWYMLYHNNKLGLANGDSKFQRSITIDYLEYNEDGTIQQVSPTGGTVRQLKNVDPYRLVQAELLGAESGVEVETLDISDTERAAALTELESGDWSGVSQVDFGSEGATVFKAYLSAAANGTFDVWIDGGPADDGGEKLGTLSFSATEASDGFSEFQFSRDEAVTGVHNLYFIYKGTEANELLFDSYLFE